MFNHLGDERCGMKGAPMFPEIEAFSRFQGFPGFLQAESKAEKDNQLRLEWVKVVVKITFLLPIPVEPEKQVTDVWLASILKVKNGSHESRNALDLLLGNCLDEGIAALQIMAEQCLKFLIHHDACS